MVLFIVLCNFVCCTMCCVLYCICFFYCVLCALQCVAHCVVTSALHIEVRISAVFHMDAPHTPLGKLSKMTRTFVFDDEVLAAIGITEEDVNKQMPDNGARRMINNRRLKENRTQQRDAHISN